jgi:CheY-like chemotaxis protein
MGSSGRPILVVDDDAALRDVLSLTLLLEGYPVREAANGAEALRLIEEEHPSLVVLDMQMPVLDGWGLARELKARELDPPILVMTAGHNAQRAAQEIGANGFVGKPFGVADLLHQGPGSSRRVTLSRQQVLCSRSHKRTPRRPSYSRRLHASL